MTNLKILLCCGAGMSSGFLASNARKTAKKRKLSLNVEARSYTEVNDYLADITPKTHNFKNGADMFVAEMAHFVDCALNGTPCRASAKDGLEVMKILDAIYESAKTGHEVIIH